MIDQIAHLFLVSANEKDLEKFMESFSLRYKDSSGTNYLYIKNITKGLFNKFDSFETQFENLTYVKKENKKFGDTVELNFDIIVTGVRNNIPSAELIGESGNLENITLILRKNEFRKWKIIRVEGVEDNSYFEW